MNKGTIVVLAGTRPHAELIKNLKARGFRTVLIDYTENPVAKEFADVHYMDSTLDVEAVERIARKENACRIMDICIDRPIPVAAFVAEKLHIPHSISYKASLVVTNKNLMKQFMLEHNIPTSKFVTFKTIDELDDLSLKYPLIVKPSDASGSIGISRVDTPHSLISAATFALDKSRNGIAIIEEFIKGPEIQIDCFVENEEPIILDIKSKRKIAEDTFSLPYGSIIPANISECGYAKINVICRQIVKSLALKNGPLYVQAIATENEIYVIEFGVRFGGGLSFKILRDVAGVDIIDATAEVYLDGSPHIQNKFSEFDGVYATFHMFPKEGVFDTVIGYEKIKNEGLFEYFVINMKKGYKCTGSLTSNERVGAFILRAKNKDELNEKLRCVIDTIDILDIEGNSIMRKDIYGII